MLDVIGFCRALAQHSESDEGTTRTFLSPPMRAVHRDLRAAMEPIGMHVRTDAAGNLRGFFPGRSPRRLVIASHIDTVPNAGAFDGVLGVVLAIALAQNYRPLELPYGIEIIAFSEEEGVRFGIPFLGSRALIGTLDAQTLDACDKQGISIARAIRDFGLDPTAVPDAALDPYAFAYLEFHIEQGPVLESLDLPLGIVEAIAGQCRWELAFHGHSNHAGTTPMNLRKDALAGAAEWITTVEREASSTPGLVATVGRLSVSPGAGNVIPDQARASLDIRHASDSTRTASLNRILDSARSIAARRNLNLETTSLLEQPAVPCDPHLTHLLAKAVEATGHQPHRMPSGAGHDAMVVAARLPIAMLFLRSPGGISHHPAETVLHSDVSAALDAGLRFIKELEHLHA